ncbi:hypothetical protein SUGI_0911070 [Cryptomeria japonica]|nr:hypothetical protein SUGI_0911070 [Cryptomeria japonica]
MLCREGRRRTRQKDGSVGLVVGGHAGPNGMEKPHFGSPGLLQFVGEENGGAANSEERGGEHEASVVAGVVCIDGYAFGGDDESVGVRMDE